MRFKRKNKGYYDPKTGKKLKSIEGRKNRPGIDEFKHLGWEVPSILKHKYNVLEYIELEEDILLKLDLLQNEANTIIGLEADYSPLVIPDKDIHQMKKDVFGFINIDND